MSVLSKVPQSAVTVVSAIVTLLIEGQIEKELMPRRANDIKVLRSMHQTILLH